MKWGLKHLHGCYPLKYLLDHLNLLYETVTGLSGYGVVDKSLVFQGHVKYEAQDDVHDLAEVKNPELVANLALLLSVTVIQVPLCISG